MPVDACPGPQDMTEASRPASEAEDQEATVPRQWLFGVIHLLTDQCKYSNNFHVDNKVKIFSVQVCMCV